MDGERSVHVYEQMWVVRAHAGVIGVLPVVAERQQQ